MTGRKRAAAAAVAGLAACLITTVGAGASTTGRADSATVYGANTHTSGNYVYSAAQGTDKLLGPIAVTYKIRVRPTNVGTFNLKAKRVVEYTSTGTLRGTGSATLTVAANGAETITNGKVSLLTGTGSLRGHSFKGTFSGTGSSTANTLVLRVTGTYK